MQERCQDFLDRKTELRTALSASTKFCAVSNMKKVDIYGLTTVFLICSILAVLVAITLKDLGQTHTHVPTGKLAKRAAFCHRPASHHGCCLQQWEDGRRKRRKSYKSTKRTLMKSSLNHRSTLWFHQGKLDDWKPSSSVGKGKAQANADEIQQSSIEFDLWCKLKMWRVYLLHINFTILTMHNYGYRCYSKNIRQKHSQIAHGDNAVFGNRKIWRNYSSFHLTWQRKASGQNIQVKHSAFSQ